MRKRKKKEITDAETEIKRGTKGGEEEDIPPRKEEEKKEAEAKTAAGEESEEEAAMAARSLQAGGDIAGVSRKGSSVHIGTIGGVVGRRGMRGGEVGIEPAFTGQRGVHDRQSNLILFSSGRAVLARRCSCFYCMIASRGRKALINTTA